MSSRLRTDKKSYENPLQSRSRVYIKVKSWEQRNDTCPHFLLDMQLEVDLPTKRVRIPTLMTNSIVIIF